MGIITDIQRFSLNDGPGIRTTVFFKGCNMACVWCHNPETLSIYPEFLIDPSQCIGCGACAECLSPGLQKNLPLSRGELSLACVDACFSGALTVAGKKMSVDQVMTEIAQDVNYYRNSGGGVTLSGGEALIQPDFARAILTACRKQGIATAVETNLCYDFSVLESILDVLDLVMADMKLLDCERHQNATGVGNEQILANVKKLAGVGVPYILRTPVIPGINDRPEDIGGIAHYIARHADHLLYYELLNFNPLGGSKYDRLGMANRYKGVRPLKNDAIAALKSAAENAGIPVRIG